MQIRIIGNRVQFPDRPCCRNEEHFSKCHWEIGKTEESDDFKSEDLPRFCTINPQDTGLYALEVSSGNLI